MSKVAVFGPKRYVKFSVTNDEVLLLSHAEGALGGFFVDPPKMQGRTSTGHRQWSTFVAQRAAARFADDDYLGAVSAWDEGETLPFPALRRLTVKNRQTARELPEDFHARAGTQYVEGLVAPIQRNLFSSVVALDPGGDISNWQELSWYDRSSGYQVRVTTDPTDVWAVLLQTLENRANEYVRPPRSSPLRTVVVDPSLVKFLGRTSGVIDAQLDGVKNLEDIRREFSGADVTKHLFDSLRDEGPAAVARRTGIPASTLSAIARGTSPGAKTLRHYADSLGSSQRIGNLCAREACPGKILRLNQRYCSRTCANSDYRAHQRSGSSCVKKSATMANVDFSQLPRCPGCSALLLGAAAERGVCRHCSSEKR